jgi:hypothetical protein
MKQLLLASLLCAAFTFLSLPSINAQDWRLAGNNDASGASKLGTLNNQPLKLFTNNVERMRVDLSGRVGIGTASPNTSALLDLSSTNRGLLAPRMTTAQRNAIASPANGLLVFQTDGIRGFYYFDAVWKPVVPASGAFANTALSNLVQPTAINVALLPNISNARDLGSVSLGWRSLYLNDAVYMNGLRFLHGDISGNTFTGTQSGISTTGSNNTGNGFHSLFSNTSGGGNVAVGYSSLALNTVGDNNIAIGPSALGSNADGFENIAIGGNASFLGVSTTRNIAIGYEALYNNFGQSNMAVGYRAMYNNQYGEINSAFGFGAMSENTEGWFNSAFGYGSMTLNNGTSNTAMGTYSLFYNQSGSNNVALGYQTLINSDAGSSNTAVGSSAGFNGVDLNAVTFIGASSGATIDNVFNATAIGSLTQSTASNQVRIGNDMVTSIGGYANWTNLSDGRFKKNMKEDVPGLEFISKLRPVTYTLDIDGLEKALERPSSINNQGNLQKGMRAPVAQEKKFSQQEISSRLAKAAIVHTGFVAQEVEKAAKELNYDFSGVDAPKNSKDFYGLRYAEFVVPLVKAVQELNEKNTALEEKNAQLEERLKRIEEIVLKGAAGGSISATLSGAQLDQNAPNPFTSNTIINYTIPENAGAGRIVITDMKGSVIRSFNLNGKGRGQLQLNSGTIAAGEYVYSLWLGEQMTASKRMTVIK